MAHVILSNVVANISELRKNPIEAVNKAHGEPLAILNHNEPVFYCLTPSRYEEMLNLIEDIEIAHIIKARKNDTEIEIRIDDL